MASIVSRIVAIASKVSAAVSKIETVLSKIETAVTKIAAVVNKIGAIKLKNLLRDNLFSQSEICFVSERQILTTTIQRTGPQASCLPLTDTSTNDPKGTYFYDGEGKRVKKITSTETTIFVY